MKEFTYRSLEERILKIRLFRVDKNLERNLDFTYINRVIVWNALGKALTSFLPFLDFTKITSFFASTASITSYCNVDSSDLDNICGICQTSSICMPYKTNVCPHIFCYYCITTSLSSSSNDSPSCPVCKTAFSGEISPV